MPFLYQLIFAAILFIFAGCAGQQRLGDISEVSLRKQTGLLGVTFTITFHRDATASGECVFYNLDVTRKPRNIEYTEPFCKDLYRNNPLAFVETKHSYNDIHLKGSFSGKISKDKFEQIAQLVNKNGFLWMRDDYVEKGVTDAPPDFTKVIYASGATQEVSDNLGKGGEKLAEIKQAIYDTARATKWESGQK